MSTLMQQILERPVPPRSVAIWWIGQAGFVLKTAAHSVIFVDPYLSDSCNRLHGLGRVVPVPIPPAEVQADLVVMTHDHDDHADIETVVPIAAASPQAQFAGPPSVGQVLRGWGIPAGRFVALQRGETKKLAGAEFTAVYAEHTPDSVGFVIRSEGIGVYISGDTSYVQPLHDIALHRPDIAILCINGRWGNLNIEEAVRLTQVLQPAVAIPMHYDMFRENSADPQEFARLLEASGSSTRPVVMDYQKPLTYNKSED